MGGYQCFSSASPLLPGNNSEMVDCRNEVVKGRSEGFGILMFILYEKLSSVIEEMVQTYRLSPQFFFVSDIRIDRSNMLWKASRNTNSCVILCF